MAAPPLLLYAPVQMPEPYCHYNTKELEIDEIQDIVKYFGISAETQREAGFDGVEIKVGHDGLLRSFVSPHFNTRSDEYGGSYENRLRIIREIVQEIRKKTSDDFPIGVRLCLDEFTPFGYSLDYGVKLAKSMQEMGLDYISTDAGTFSSFYMEIPPMVIPLGFSVYMCAELRKVVDIPLIAFGRINDPVQAESILEGGYADFIGMARQLICDPETPNKTMEGRLDDIRHCIACNDGCLYQAAKQQPIRCIQNPGAGREAEYGIGTLDQAERVKKVTVIGGGIAGMKAAEICAKRGHKVTLYEKSGILGGQINLAAKIPYRAEVEEVARYIRLQLEEQNVEIHLNTEMTLEMLQGIDADEIIIATGSHPYIPEYVGVDETNITILSVREALVSPERIGDVVVVFDNNGHWQGAGACEYAQAIGAKVHCVTSDFQLGIEMQSTNVPLLHQRLFENGMTLHASSSIIALENNAVVIKHNFSEEISRITDVDTMIVADRSCSDNELYLQAKAKGLKVYSIGDCAAPRMVEQIIFEAETLARTL
ncbi:oxidoreductase [Ruminococcus bromii]|uniref:oxidoreductase n=1 Tax=Ruminococcus bromii TaxID=40518 RepID=UPI003FD7B09F